MPIKNIFTIIAISIVVSCGQPTNFSENDEKAKSTTQLKSGILDKYNLFLSKLDSLDVGTSTLAAQKFQELFKNQKDSEIRDEAFMSFNSYYEKLDRNINEQHKKDTTSYEPLVFLSDSGKRPKLTKYLQDYNDNLKRSGFEVSSTEGMTFIQQDRDFLAKWFYDYVSTTMKEYLVQLNKENKEGFSEDAGLILSPEQFVNRIIWWEQFIKKHLDFILLSEAKERGKYFLTFLIIGMDNTHVVSYENGSLENYYETAYSYLEKSYPTSITNKVVRPYYKALLKKEQVKAQALVKDYRKMGIILRFE